MPLRYRRIQVPLESLDEEISSVDEPLRQRRRVNSSSSSSSSSSESSSSSSVRSFDWQDNYPCEEEEEEEEEIESNNDLSHSEFSSFSHLFNLLSGNIGHHSFYDNNHFNNLFQTYESRGCPDGHRVVQELRRLRVLQGQREEHLDRLMRDWVYQREQWGRMGLLLEEWERKMSSYGFVCGSSLEPFVRQWDWERVDR